MLGPQQPTIVLIIAGDRGHADPGCTGQTGYATSEAYQPLAAGMRLTQACNSDWHDPRLVGDEHAVHNPHLLS